MAFTRISVKFFSIGFLLSFCLVQNVVNQSTKVFTQSNSASWQGKSPFKEFWQLKSENDQGEEALLLKLFKLLTKENAAYKRIENSDILKANANLKFEIKEKADEKQSQVTLQIVLNTAENQNSESKNDKTTSDQNSAKSTSPDASQPSTAAKGSQPSDFSKKVVSRHNVYRKKHKVPDLTYSAQISKVSQDWANQLAKTDQFKHRPNNKYGENIYVYWSSNAKNQVSPNAPVDAWYAESKHYTYSGSPNIAAVGHFTQLVWKNSKQIGVGVAKSSKTNKQYVVCNYSPPGNVIGQFPQNVLKP